jgi:Protein of unknown function (DUF4236)
MGWRFHRSKSFGPFRFSVGKRGVGVSVGVPGARIGIGADGRVRETYGIPSTGISYQQTRATYAGQGSRRTIARSLPYHPGRPATAKPISLGVGCAGGMLLMGGCSVVSVNLKPSPELAPILTLIGLLVALVFPLVLRAWSARQAARQNEAAFSVYLQGLIDRFGEDAARQMVDGDPWQGATQDMVRVMYGAPDDVSTEVYKTRTSETWKYVPIAKNRYTLRITFENGVCVGWQTA